MFRKRPPSVTTTRAGTATSSAQRRFARAAVDLPTAYAVDGRAGSRSGHITDLGGGGLRLETDEDLPSGTALELEFSIPGRPVGASGRVVMSYFDATSKRFGHGVAFTAIEPAAQEAIAGYVLALARG